MNDAGYGISPVIHELMQVSARMRVMSGEPKTPDSSQAVIVDKEAKTLSSFQQLMKRATNFCRRHGRAMREMTRREVLAYIAPAWREGAMISRALYMVCDAKTDWNRNEGHAWDEVLAWEIRNPPWYSKHNH